jgi:hypothetical protein
MCMFYSKALACRPRTSIATDRLTGLALLYVHRNSPVVTDVKPIDIVKKLDASLHRRIALAFDVDEHK